MVSKSQLRLNEDGLPFYDFTNPHVIEGLQLKMLSVCKIDPESEDCKQFKKDYQLTLAANKCYANPIDLGVCGQIKKDLRFIGKLPKTSENLTSSQALFELRNTGLPYVNPYTDKKFLDWLNETEKDSVHLRTKNRIQSGNAVRRHNMILFIGLFFVGVGLFLYFKDKENHKDV